jgi:hypothetical protein
MPISYDVFTTLSPDELTAAAHEVLQKWIAFAMGEESLAGYRVLNPTGRMASNIRVEDRGPNHIAVIADSPEAEILEEGHKEIDLKQHLIGGRAYPMHRGTGTPIYNPTMGGRAANVWAVPRAAGFNGVARIPSVITAENADSWIIPAMTAWTPAFHLSELLRNGEL